ncbi:MAG: hypothetical protein WAM82_06055 [Thermoanaerobaculia bacterium]
MTRVETIEREIQNLPQEEFEEIREWILEQDWQRWDQKIEQDAASGKLDKLFEKAHHDLDHLAGTWSEEEASTFEAALLEQRRRPLKELLLAETPRAELPVLPRRRLRRRSPEALE